MGVKRSSSTVFVVLLLVVSMAVTSPVVKAQPNFLGGPLGLVLGLLGGLSGGSTSGLTGALGGLNGGLTGGAPGGDILTQLLNTIFGLPITQISSTLYSITGTLFCALNATTSSPPFPNAIVLLQFNGTIVANSTTNAMGSFSLIVNPSINISLTTFLNSSRIVIPTPLSSCNATLPSTGALVAPLQNIGNSTIGRSLTLVNIVPLTFTYVSNLLAILLGLI